MSLPLWKQSAPAAGQKEIESQPAEVVAERTEELLMTRGWCLWRCSVLSGEVIAVTRDALVEEVPVGYPVYTKLELELLLEADDAAVRLVHEAKKLAGARVIPGSTGRPLRREHEENSL